MSLGNPPIFKGPTCSIFYADGVSATFNFKNVVLTAAGTFLVLVSGVFSNDYTYTPTSITFNFVPALGTKIVVFFYSKNYGIHELSDGSVSKDKLTDLKLKSLHDVDMSVADQTFYGADANNFTSAAARSLGRQISGFASVASVPTVTPNALRTTTDQAVSGNITLASRPGSPVRKPITWVTQLSQNGLAFLMDGELYTIGGSTGTWGSSATGRGLSGQNPAIGADHFKKVVLPSSSPIVKVITPGPNDLMVLLADGSLYAWGSNGAGCAGLGNTTALGFPILVASSVVAAWGMVGGASYVASATAQSRIFIKKTDGYIYAAGHNGNGQLGIGNNTNPTTTFTQVTSLGTNVTNIFSVNAEGGKVFFQKSDDTIWAAGYNGAGELGITPASTTAVSTPVDVTAAWQGGSGWNLEFVSGAASYYNGSAAAFIGFTIMLLRNRTTGVSKVLTCGYGGQGALGNGGTTNIAIPYLIPNSGAVKQVSCNSGLGTVHLLNNDGSLYGWGHNGEGEVGNGATVNVVSPALIFGAGQVDAIMADGFTQYANSTVSTSYIRKTDNLLYATGYNAFATIGCGDTTNRSSFTQVMVPNNDKITMLGYSDALNNANTILGVGASGKLYIWGQNGTNLCTSNNTINCLVPTNIKIKDDL